MKSPKIKPTESELQILQILWSQGPSTVRLVNEEMNKVKETGYTTTLKLMQIMVDKGILKRDTSHRTHIYKATLSQEDTQRDLLSSFLNSTFRGSAMSLVMQTLGNHSATPEELKKIKRLITELENK